MPSNFGEDSDLCKMLRVISPWFEHKLFLTATPHNGHTRCFSGNFFVATIGALHADDGVHGGGAEAGGRGGGPTTQARGKRAGR